MTSALVTGINEFLDLFDKKTSDLDPALQETETALSKIRQEIKALQGKINKNRFDQRHKHKRYKTSRTFNVILFLHLHIRSYYIYFFST